MNTKLIITILVTLVGCSALFLLGDGSDDSDAAVVASGTCGTDLTWEYDDATKTLTISGSGTTMADYSYTASRAMPWADYKASITDVVFNTTGLTSIGSYAFYKCDILVNCNLPDTIESIKEGSFSGCSQMDMEKLPDGLKSIGVNAFQKCTTLSLTTLPTSIEVLEIGAFKECSSLSLDSIPANLTRLEEFVFSDCVSLQVTKLPSGLTYIGRNAMSRVHIDSLVIPIGVVTLDNYAFSGCPITNLTLSPNTTSIGASCFANCTNLKRVIVPTGFSATITADAFNGCNNLKEILNFSSLDIVAGADTYGKIAKYATNVYTPTATGTCGTDLNWAYVSENTTLYVYGSGTTMDQLTRTGGTEIYYSTKTTSVIFDTPNLSTIKYNVFNGYRAMTTCELPDSVTRIESSVFENCFELRMTHLPEGLTYLGGAFIGCSHLNLEYLPVGLTTIAQNSFANCTRLALTELPEGITSIGAQAFGGCSNLKLTKLPSNLQTIGDSAFRGTACTFNTLPLSLTSIGAQAFQSNTAFTSMVIPEGFSATIGSNAFDGCTNLKEILNLSDLDIVAGADTYGKIAYYADTVSDHVDSTAMVQQKEFIDHHVVTKDDPASKILTILPILVVLGIVMMIAGVTLFRSRGSDY